MTANTTPVITTPGATGRPAAITATALTKSYGEHRVLDGIDLRVPEGTVFALLGPNGAGKTTTVQILSTLIPADAGEASVAGCDLMRETEGVRRAIGVTGQFSAVDNLLTAEENLMLMADLNHLPRREGRRRAAELLRRFELTEATAKPVVAFSGGMRRKLDLAMTLIGDPRIIFLDEPTTGLDPRSRRTMWEIIRALVADDGITIFLTTQYLEEADQLADRVAVLDHGSIVAEGTADELKRRIPGGHIRLRFADGTRLEAAAVLFDAVAVKPDSEALTLHIPGDGSIPNLRAVLDALDGAGLEAEELTVHTPDLDDVFLTLTGNAAKEPAR
jgi:ABC-2 type transport system ATP-binding protein